MGTGAWRTRLMAFRSYAAFPWSLGLSLAARIRVGFPAWLAVGFVGGVGHSAGDEVPVQVFNATAFVAGRVEKPVEGGGQSSPDRTGVPEP